MVTFLAFVLIVIGGLDVVVAFGGYWPTMTPNVILLSQGLLLMALGSLLARALFARVL